MRERADANRTREAGHLDEIQALNNITAGARERADANRTREAGHLDEIQALNNITTGVREREDANRTREAGHLDEIQGSVASTLMLSRNGVACRVSIFTLVGFIVWLGFIRGNQETDYTMMVSALMNSNPNRSALLL